MTGRTPEAVLLDEARAAFIQRFVGINVAARDADRLPSVTRGLGCKVSTDRREVTVFVSVPRAERVLAALRDNGVIAVVFGQPTTHASLQLKGSDARIGPLEDGDRAVIEACRESFVADLAQVGYTPEFARASVPSSDEELVAVRFTPSAVFDQTPGPGAGQRLGASA